MDGADVKAVVGSDGGVGAAAGRGTDVEAVSFHEWERVLPYFAPRLSQQTSSQQTPSQQTGQWPVGDGTRRSWAALLVCSIRCMRRRMQSGSISRTG